MVKQVLSCDWGTSFLRVRLIDTADKAILAEAIDGKGIAVVYNDWLQSGLPENKRALFYTNILVRQIKGLSTSRLSGLPIIISGMASASIGMMELPYTAIPFKINGGQLNVEKIAADEKFEHDVLLISGLKTNKDVMRGEETMIVGCDIKTSSTKQLFIFPGTHSKQVIVQNGSVIDLKTYMTGELFDLLHNKSILAASVEPDNISSIGNDQFTKGIEEAKDSNFLNNIFHVRAKHLFGELGKKENHHYLSGLLIGEELKDIDKEDYENITVVSTGSLLARYTEALIALNLKHKLRQQNAVEALIKGQILIFNQQQQ